MASINPLWVCLLSMMVFTACAPVQVTYLKPSAPSVEYTRSTCGGAAGPEDRALLVGPDGYTFRIESYYLEEASSINQWAEQRAEKQNNVIYRASHLYPRGTGITIIVEAQQDRSAPIRFLSNSFFLTDEETGAVYEFLAEHVWLFKDPGVFLDGPVAAALVIRYGDPRVKVETSHIATRPKWAESAGSILQSPRRELRHLDPLQPLPPIPPQREWLNIVHRPYYVILAFENVRSDQFRLRLPSVSVDATPFNFPEITFRLTNERIIVPFNC